MGLSRSNGFDLNNDVDKIIDFVKTIKFDYFFNNEYCNECVIKWYSSNVKCPLCRQDIRDLIEVETSILD
jgi:hypothetical protein